MNQKTAEFITDGVIYSRGDVVSIYHAGDTVKIFEVVSEIEVDVMITNGESKGMRTIVNKEKLNFHK